MLHLVVLFISLFAVGNAKINYEEVRVEKYSIVLLQCKIRKKEDFTWLKGEVPIRDTPGKYTIFQNGTLKITKVTFSDVGVYRCRIAGKTLHSHYTKLLISAETIITKAESNVIMFCAADFPTKASKRTYSFFAIDSYNRRTLIKEDGKVMENCEDCGSGGEDVLQINRIRKRHEGKYLCTVRWNSENQKGLSMYFFYIQVKELKTTIQPSTSAGHAKREIRNSSGKITRDTSYLAVLLSILAIFQMTDNGT